MRFFYSEIKEITLTFTAISHNAYGMEYMTIDYERPNINGFDFLEMILPSLEIKKSYGFSQDEISELIDYAQRNSFIMWDIARENMREKDEIAASI